MEFMATFFAIFRLKTHTLHHRMWLTLLVNLFEHIGLQANTLKMQTMICTPGWIRTQLSTESYSWMQQGQVKVSESSQTPICLTLNISDTR